MDLIDYNLKESKLNVQTSKIFKIAPLYEKKISNTKKTVEDQLTDIYHLITRIDQFQIISKSQYCKEKQLFNVSMFLAGDYIMKSANKIQKLLLIRYFLKINSHYQLFKLVIHPISGLIKYRLNLQFGCLDLQSQLEQFCLKLKEVVQSKLLYQMKKVLCLLSKDYFASKHRGQLFLSEILHSLKESISTSHFYSWNILESTTFSSNSKKVKNQLYLQYKQKYFNIRKVQKQNQQIGVLTQIYNTRIESIDSYMDISNEQDDQLKIQYLNKPKLVHKSEKQINQITVSENDFQTARKQKLAKLNCYELGSIRVTVQKFNEQYREKLKYQRKVIESLPALEFLGLPKYYFIKNLKEATALYTFTNLVSIKSWTHYLKSNHQVVSLFTIFDMIDQVVAILRYLRDSRVVYHNLIGKNLGVRRNLIVTIIDFTNSFHEKAAIALWKSNSISNYQIVKNKLPSVLNIIELKNFSSYEDERSDVHSLGILIYEVLFGCNPHRIKQSSFSNQKYIIQKILKNPLICLEKANQMHFELLKLVINFVTCCLKKSDYDIETQEHKIRLNCQPYLDWAYICTDQMKQFLKQNFLA